VTALAQIIADADDRGHIVGTHHLSTNVFKYFANPMTLFSMQINVPLASVHQEALAARAQAVAASTGGNGFLTIYSENTVEKGSATSEVRSYIWEIAMAGVMPMRLGMDITKTPVATLQACHYQQQFMELTDVATMANADSLVFLGTKYVLADQGRSYIAYSPALSGDMGIKALTAGTYKLTWLDCTTGARVEQASVAVTGGDTGFARPSGIGTWCALWAIRTTTGGAGTMQWSTLGTSVTEGAASDTLTLSRSNGSTGAASVAWATANGTATQGGDYAPGSGTVTWAAGDAANRTVTIALLDDALVEGSETFAVNLSNASGAALGTTTAATVTIADNEQAANQAPVAQNQAIPAVSGQGLSISLLMADADGPGPYSYTITAEPTHGTLVGNANNNDWTYTPTAGYVGGDSFAWTVSDGALSSNTAVCTLTVSVASIGSSPSR